MDSYNSLYPLEYYKIGTPYMFYFSNINTHGKPASMDSIKKYGPVLNKTANLKGSGFPFAKRVVGVVIEKNDNGTIDVLFQGVSNDKTVYMVKKYITSYRGVFCDDKEQFDVSGIVDLTGSINVTFADSKGGGIDLDIGRSGGIDLDEGNKSGGIDLG